MISLTSIELGYKVQSAILLIKSHPTEEMRFVKIGFCGVRIFNVILWCPHF